VPLIGMMDHYPEEFEHAVKHGTVATPAIPLAAD
jgi:hypothetical protein